MKWVLPLLAFLSACAANPPIAPIAPIDIAEPLDVLARDYVQATLEIGEREEGYVDAYY